MKGPYQRLKYDFRRLWECPACHRRARSSGLVTMMFCECTAGSGGAPTGMTLLYDGQPTAIPHRSVVDTTPPAQNAQEVIERELVGEAVADEARSEDAGDAQIGDAQI